MNNTIFEYFSITCGEVDRVGDINLRNKYDTYTVKDLKKELKRLKLNDGSIWEIKFVSRKLSGLLSNKQEIKCHNHDNYVKKIFWGYVKNIITYESSVLPTFNKSDCLSFFKKYLSVRSPSKSFSIPSWIPSLATPQVPFNLDTPPFSKLLGLFVV